MNAKKKISKINDLMLTYKEGAMLPSFLCYLGIHLKVDDEVSYIEWLEEKVFFYARLKGFYKKYSRLEEEYNFLLEEEYKKRKGVNNWILS